MSALNRIDEGTLDFVEYEETGNKDKKSRCDVDDTGVKRDGASAGEHPSGAFRYKGHGVAPEQNLPLRRNNKQCRIRSRLTMSQSRS